MTTRLVRIELISSIFQTRLCKSPSYHSISCGNTPRSQKHHSRSIFCISTDFMMWIVLFNKKFSKDLARMLLFWDKQKKIYLWQIVTFDFHRSFQRNKLWQRLSLITNILEIKQMSLFSFNSLLIWIFRLEFARAREMARAHVSRTFA